MPGMCDTRVTCGRAGLEQEHMVIRALDETGSHRTAG
jgi:hypothetical protein